ncbi:MAG: hypothetical protein C4536_08590 [Actinobacteria bacterium]|jgi:hypothetical protein|nr:MAG: hypothetical protein C4536_08590 [Actinomycetota bacterium]
MPECVSCGKEIPAGKFFCEACYVKMKGQRGRLKKVPPAPVKKPDVEPPPPAVDSVKVAEAEPVVPAGVTTDKKASGTLTPASSKKVVSLKPAVDKVARDRTTKKRFSITITFSERTYAALARLKRRKSADEPATEEGDGAAVESPVATRKGVRRKGPHGRPKLKAVASVRKPAAENREGFMRFVAYRDHALDRRDMIAAAMATLAVLMIVILSFTSWVRVGWNDAATGMLQTAKVKGVDLGVITYICMAIVIIAYLYMVATWLFKGPFAKVDYGVLLIAAGVVVIPLFFIAIASNSLILGAALEKVGRGGQPIPAQFERQTLWPSYVMVIMGAVLGFSGLVRLSERKGGPGEGEG